MAVDPHVVALGGRTVGQGEPAFVIAEIGVNHNGSVALAHRLIDAAASAGADAAKFQTFSAELVAHEEAETVAYQRAAGYERGQIEMLRSLELPLGAWSELRAHCDDVGLMFVSTAFDRPSLDLVCSLDPAFLKIPSGEFTNRGYVDMVAARGRPIVASTGMCDIDEVERTTAVLRAVGVPHVLLHTVTAYPAPLADANLRAIRTLHERFGVPVGWSDHTAGSLSAIVARSIGSCVFERHLTLDRTAVGPDHAASSEPDELAAYIRAIHEVDLALGTGVKLRGASERAVVESVRRGHYAARPLERGRVLTEEDLVQLRPARGVPASEVIVGRELIRSVGRGEPIEELDLRDDRSSSREEETGKAP